MGDLKVANTNYPSALDTATTISDLVDEVIASHQNGPNSAIVAIETALGLNPQGSVADLATRLAVLIHADGGALRGAAFPASPVNKPHFFYRTDEAILYFYNTSTANYDVIANLAVLGNYVRKDVDTTITAQHTFNPAIASPPFILGANAQGQKVIGLDAETVDGKNPASPSGIATLNASSLVVQEPASKAQASGVASLNASSKVVQDPASAGSGNGLDADTVDTYHMDQGVKTTDSPSFAAVTAPNVDATTRVKTDSIIEKTSAAGVTVDSCLIKDGKAAAALLADEATAVINNGGTSLNFKTFSSSASIASGASNTFSIDLGAAPTGFFIIFRIRTGTTSNTDSYKLSYAAIHRPGSGADGKRVYYSGGFGTAAADPADPGEYDINVNVRNNAANTETVICELLVITY